MSSPSPQHDPISPDDTLPSVERPNAAFLMQLFIVPAIIVLCVFGVAMFISWLSAKRTDPKQYIAVLQRSGPGRWQAAEDLASILRDERHLEFKQDHSAAQQLASLLQAEIDSQKMDENALSLRGFLCRALGEFHVDNGLPVLLTAASTQRVDKELYVRQAALEALAVLSDSLSKADPPGTLDRPEVIETLLKQMEDPAVIIRSTAVFASGVIGASDLLEKLESLLGDPESDVRYNAATALARHGREKAIPVLEEMLAAEWTRATPDELARLSRTERDEVSSREYRQALVFANALRAVEQLAKANPKADMEPIVATIDSLDQKYFPPDLKNALAKAREALSGEAAAASK